MIHSAKEFQIFYRLLECGQVYHTGIQVEEYIQTCLFMASTCLYGWIRSLTRKSFHASVNIPCETSCLIREHLRRYLKIPRGDQQVSQEFAADAFLPDSCVFSSSLNPTHGGVCTIHSYGNTTTANTALQSDLYNTPVPRSIPYISHTPNTLYA